MCTQLTGGRAQEFGGHIQVSEFRVEVYTAGRGRYILVYTHTHSVALSGQIQTCRQVIRSHVIRLHVEDALTSVLRSGSRSGLNEIMTALRPNIPTGKLRTKIVKSQK